jgi:hypothetical protein
MGGQDGADFLSWELTRYGLPASVLNVSSASFFGIRNFSNRQLVIF